MVEDQINMDYRRTDRIGISETVLCGSKTTEQLVTILQQAENNRKAFLFTRLETNQFAEIPDIFKNQMDYDPLSRTAFYGDPTKFSDKKQIAVVTAGSSDLPVSREAIRTLTFNGYPVQEINDVGVAGIWRLMERLDDFKDLPVIIAVAGMDAALVSVIGGLVSRMVIGVPTSVGYGVADGGKTALHSMLTSCAPGIVTVNIDNGYGAAIAAIRFLRQLNR